MKKLISMVDYVLDYANFLKQPLEKWMFVPCDEDGEVLEEPRREPFQDGQKYDDLVIQFKQAKEQCLFQNFIYDEEMDVVRNNYGVEIDLKEELTIEDLIKYNLEYEINR